MEQAEACLTKDSNTDEALTGIKAFHKDLKLLGQLFTLGTVLLEFTSHTRHDISGHSRDSDGSEDIANRGDELSFDHVDRHVINEAFQSNPYSQKGVSKGDSGSRGRREIEIESRPCNTPPYNPKLRNRRSDSCLVLCVVPK